MKVFAPVAVNNHFSSDIPLIADRVIFKIVRLLAHSTTCLLVATKRACQLPTTDAKSRSGQRACQFWSNPLC